MWQKIIQIILQYLFLPLFKDAIVWVRDYFARRAEMKKRHQENKEKVEAYEQAPAASSTDDFSKLP